MELVWAKLTVLPLTDGVSRTAAEMLSKYPLSGADAVQLSTALHSPLGFRQEFVTWDRRLSNAASELGFVVIPDPD